MANTYKALSSVTVGSGGVVSVSFTNIPQTYTDLVVQFSARSNYTAGSYGDGLRVSFNSDTSTSNYSNRYFQAYDASADSSSSSANLVTGLIPDDAAAQTANVFSNNEHYIPNYASNILKKSVSVQNVVEKNGTTNWVLQRYSILYNSTAPITSITYTPSTSFVFKEFTTFTLYGVFNADVSSAPATPTIGTATAGDALASITFTGVSNAASYTMTSTPSSITGTGTTSPITVSGLTNGTAYTFKVKSNNPFGSSAESAASNSVTPVQLPAFDSISTLTLGSNQSTIDITSIPSTYTHLQLRGFYTFTGNGGTPRMRLGTGGTVNTGAVYSFLETYGSGNTFSGWQGDASAGQTEMYLGLGGEQTTRNSFVINFYDYANTNKNKTLSWIIGIGSSQIHTGQGSMNTTAALTNIQFFTQVNPFAAGSTFALYGIKG